jgi:hypothetical protein
MSASGSKPQLNSASLPTANGRIRSVAHRVQSTAIDHNRSLTIIPQSAKSTTLYVHATFTQKFTPRPNLMNASTAKRILLLSVLLFTASLITPAFSYDGDPGVRVNCLGWFPLFAGLLPALFGLIGLPQGQFEYIGTISWFANPLSLIGWIGIYTKSPIISMTSGVISLCLSLLFLLTKTIPAPDNETMRNVSVNVGYFLWLSSMVCTLIASSCLKSSK